MLPKGQLRITLSAKLSTCGCRTWAPGQVQDAISGAPEILRYHRFHYHSKNLNLQTYFQKSAHSELQKNEQLKVLPRGLVDLQCYFQFTFFCSINHVFSKLIPLVNNKKWRSAGKEEITPENSKYFISTLAVLRARNATRGILAEKYKDNINLLKILQ